MQAKFSKKQQWFSLMLSSTFCLTACGKQTAPTSNIKLTNGITVDGNSFPAVVLLMAPTTEGPRICTAFFVNEHQALTAAHCLKDLDKDGPELYLVDSRIDAADQPAYDYKARALRIAIHPDYISDNRNLQANDVAMVEFAAGSAPATLRLSNHTVQANDSIVLVGFGSSENHSTSPTTQSGLGTGVKRYGQNTIKTVQNGILSLAGVAASKANLKPGQYVATGLGDSGSPLLYKGELVAMTIAGEVRQGSGGQITSFSYSVELNNSSSQAFLNKVLD